jgi:maltose-binding protein MalE
MNMMKKGILIAAIAVLSLSILAGCAKTPETTTTHTVPPQGNYSVSGDMSVDTAREATPAEVAKGADAEEMK